MTNVSVKAIKNLGRRAVEKGQREDPRRPVFLKLNQSVLDWFKALGPGYQARINQTLIDFVDEVQRLEKEAAMPREAVARISKAEVSNNEGYLRLEYAQGLFRKYFDRCFWDMKKESEITLAHLPMIIDRLRKFGGHEGYKEAAKLCQ